MVGLTVASLIRVALVPSLTLGHHHMGHSPSITVAALIVPLVVYLALNQLLVAGIIRAVAPATPWRTLAGDGELWIMAVVDVCAGIVMAVMALFSLDAEVAGLIPILVLQRAVVHTHLVDATRHEVKTGLANPLWWRDQAGRAVNGARRSGEPLAVMIVDLDRFKAVNDRYGHLHGDTVLAAVADLLRVGVRPGDLVGRFGGDEFTVLLPGADQTTAEAVAERLRAQVATMSQPIAAGSDGPVVTASIGVAFLGRSGDDVEGLLDAADQAMYRAKAAGGNCLALAPPSADAEAPQQWDPVSLERPGDLTPS